MIYYIRKINGVVPPVPQELVMTRYTLDLDARRTAGGLLIRNPVAQKFKYEIEFPVMSKAQMQPVMQMLNSENFIVEYEDMFTGVVKTGNFYHGDISLQILKTRGTDNSDVWFKPFKVSVVEY